MLAPGFHFDIAAREYHADCAEVPSLSSSIAKVLVTEAPRKAWIAHPRLNPEPQEESDPTRPKEIGTAAHKLILGRGEEIVVIDADSYTKGDAKKARAEAYAAGSSPILRGDLETAEALSRAFQEQIALVDDCGGFSTARSEVVAVAQDESGAMLRCMMDRFEDHGTHAIIWDVKTGEQSAAPEGIGRRIANMGMEIQAALYERIVLTLRPELAGRLRFRWAFIENDPPHLLTVAELDAAGMTMGRKKVAAAIAMWNRCMQTGNWPGYPAQIVTAEYPSYAESQWLARENADELLQSMALDPFNMRSPWRPAEPAKSTFTEFMP